MDDAIALRLPQLQRSLNSYFSEFRQARRLQTSLLSRVEKKVLLWLAARTPAAINSDHRTWPLRPDELADCHWSARGLFAAHGGDLPGHVHPRHVPDFFLFF